MALKHIEIGTDDCAFDWVLKSDKNADYPENNSDMIRKLIKRHNDMVDYINELEQKILKAEQSDPQGN